MVRNQEQELTFVLFLARLIWRWYVAAAALLGLLAFPGEIASRLGLLWRWPELPKEVFLAILLGAVVYSAYDLCREVTTAARNAARVEALSEGELRFDIDPRHTQTYPFSDRRGRFVLIYGTIRSSANTAVKITSMKLFDRDGREYLAIDPPRDIETINNTKVGIGQSSSHFNPSGILMLEPNRPREVVAVFQGNHEEWRGATPTAAYTLTIHDDRGRSVQTDFSSRVHRGESL